MGKKTSKRHHQLRTLKLGAGYDDFIILVGILAGLWLVNFLTWLPAYVEVWNMARDPMAEKGVLGLKLKSSRERHRIPTERGFLKKEYISIS